MILSAINSTLNNQKGIALITVSMVSLFITTLSSAAYAKAFVETRQISRETERVRSFAAAEAAIQSGMAQIGQNAYTGFINTNSLNVSNFQTANGEEAGGSFGATIQYPNQADWVIITGTGTINGETRSVEARVFLESNLSKYLVYSTSSTFSSGTNAQYGYHDGIHPEGVPLNEKDRAAMYFEGTWNASGSNVHLYGDVNAENQISGNSSTYVHGDTYSQSYTTDANGNVTNDGVSGGVNVNDGFDDGADRNQDGVVDSYDYPDYHDVTSDGVGDSHAVETIVQIDHTFYSTHNSVPTFGSTTANRFLEFQQSPNNPNGTQIVQYDNNNYQNVIATYDLPAVAIVYVKGDAYVRGEIEGRVSVVASDDIHLMDTVSYTNGQSTADANHSAGFMAKDKMYFKANDMEVSGILYGENSGGGTVFNSSYNTDGVYEPETKERLRLHGNRVMNGSTNLSNYDDRVYGYDSNLKYYRPPGIPVVPEVRTVREV